MGTMCANGEQVKSREGGLFYICQQGDYKGNHCKFVKMCTKGYYKMTSVECKNFALKK